ncbi:MAG: cyclase family protein, partial [Calditrichota bacterium]
MKVDLHISGRSYNADLSKPLDISLPAGDVKCFHAPDFAAEPLVSGDFIGSVKEGAPVNFFNVRINPHGNGTHTECIGHITEANESIHQLLDSYHFPARLVSVPLKKLKNGDQVVSIKALQTACPEKLPEALILRTLPNSDDKMRKDYSDTNP